MINSYDKVARSIRYQLFIDESVFEALKIRAEQEGYLNLGQYLRAVIKRELGINREGELKYGKQ